MEPLKIHLDALEMAGKMLDKHITADSNFPSLINLMHYNAQGGPTVSGLDDHDYPNLSGTSISFSTINQMRMHGKVPLPSEVMEHFGHMQCHCMMGLFTDISKAWLTIDSDIYVWSYENGADVAYFDGLNETIISVGLVKPKPGIFQSYVKYLLILTTTIEISVLGVTFSDTNDGTPGEMQLVPEPIFIVPTDGIAITTIANTNSGRIFLGGRNGSLYEIYYQAESSWFGKRCKKINHSEGPLSFLVPSFVTVALSEEEAIVQISVDDSRNILYTLGDKGTIAVWDIDKGNASKITSVSQASLVQNAVHVVKTLDSNNFRPLVSISALAESESIHLNLVAVAATGTRFYLTCSSIANPSSRPHCLQLIHVRLPPGYAANAPISRPRKVQMAHYRKGTLLLICGGDTETAWCLSNDAYPFTNYLAETQSVLPLDSPAWAMAEIPGETVVHIEKQTNPHGDPPLLVRQHMEAPRKFIFLTAQGAIILVQVRPVDILRQLLLEQRGPDTEAVRMYFQNQSAEQACATCLILATLESSQNAQLSDWATRAFFLYGAQKIPTFPSGLDSHYGFSSLQTGDLRTSTPRAQGFDARSPIHRLHSQMRTNPDKALQQFSGKHGGLYLYVGRILRPIWNVRCIKLETVNNKVQILSTIPSADIAWIQGHLQALRAFLNKNTNISKQHNTIRNSSNGFESTMSPHIQEPIIEERNSLDALKVFITHACEVLGLWRILCENQLHNIVSCLTKDQINQFTTATYRDLILIGHEISSLLIIHLIDSYLGDNASIDAVSSKLREVCPNLYRNEDAVCSKANEIILKAKSCTSPEEKDSYLQSALKLCKEVAPHLNLGAVCQQFVACQFYFGVLELCLCCAERVDPNNAALHYYKNNEPADDQEGNLAYVKRIEIYKEFTAMLDHLYNQSISNPLTPTVPSKPGPPQHNNSTTSVPAKEALHEIIDDGLNSPCEILHTSIYSWMIDRGLHGELVALPVTSLEAYLIRVNAPELLWQYYERNKNHAAAAKILDALASKSGLEVSLAQRVEYLARAVVCMRSDQVGYAPHLGIFLRELEDKLEVARIQQQILDTICSLQQSPNSQNVNSVQFDEMRLNLSLLDITQLYEEYAERLQLWECKLAIIHCSGHQDSMLIQGIWTNIIENELKNANAPSADDKMAILMSKIKLLGQEYSGTPHCFPIDFLIKQLELRACRLRVSNSHIIAGFLQMGVSIEDLLDLYDKMIGGNDRTWLTEGNEFHLIESTANLVNYFTTNSNITNTFTRRKITAKCQDVISKCLTMVYAKPNTDELISKLRSILSVLARM
ncbi:nuclear pore complex protein Nup155 [Neodiprion virginianus]|uniref:nuclear pore complex protein Nup155 n=1 Tax=Neodiprion fabricii TaxID=2872261 RepID=UPI001ED90EF3|nr:nuclear pore complex protein Nup155 [Neodiprion fabricii]XP_046432877.1 nuclear pore complex protein Nup155 [Neodiprion fabricii]XP_046625916.1 nuclear pore complex protein Nup155 [Neodiprion virginianus]XP_046625917.1 nuclear pore complex protein Nup155 [Neodiprion virginianus]